MRWLLLHPDTLINNDSYYDEHSLNLVRNKFCKVAQDYCNKWGYDYLRDNEDLISKYGKKELSGWALSTCNKILQVKKNLTNYDYICVMDTYDTLITNQELPLTNFINESDSLFIGRDVYYDKKDIFPIGINSGWVIFKNDDKVKKFLDNYILSIFELEETGDSFNDQNLMGRAYHLTEDKDFINYDDKLKQSYWLYNSPYEYEIKTGNYSRLFKTFYSEYLWRPGDFMIHMCGHPDRFKKLENFYDILYQK